MRVVYRQREENVHALLQVGSRVGRRQEESDNGQRAGRPGHPDKTADKLSILSLTQADIAVRGQCACQAMLLWVKMPSLGLDLSGPSPARTLFTASLHLTQQRSAPAGSFAPGHPLQISLADAQRDHRLIRLSVTRTLFHHRASILRCRVCRPAPCQGLATKTPPLRHSSSLGTGGATFLRARLSDLSATSSAFVCPVTLST